MKHAEAFVLAPLIALSPMSDTRSAFSQELPEDMCTTGGAVLERGESENGRSILRELNELMSRALATKDESEALALSNAFLASALSCTPGDVGAAQVTLLNLPADQFENEDERYGKHSLLEILKDILEEMYRLRRLSDPPSINTSA